MARSGMSNLILRLRGMTDTSESEYTVNSVAWWTDDQLQDILDQHRTDWSDVELVVQPEYVSGDWATRDYHLPRMNWEEYTSDSDIWRVVDTDGAAVSTSTYTADYLTGVIRFSSDQDHAIYYLRGRSFNLDAAAADVWRRKMAHYANTSFNFAADGQRFDRHQLVQSAMMMIQMYEKSGGAKSSPFVRSDLA